MKKILLILIYIASFGIAFSQTNILPTIIPPSPNAASMEQYIETPVGLYTGTPKISIPIWNIKVGNINLPITLDYQSGGIKVADIASWVGLGWNLNAGGSISRTVLGNADESNTFGFWSLPFPADTDVNAFYGYATGAYDGQPDMFYFNFPGYSGRFVFDKAKNIHLIPFQNIKISMLGIQYLYFNISGAPEDGSDNAITGWKITGADGTTYIYDQYEETITNGLELNNGALVTGTSYKNSVNNWLLSEIISTTADTIKFNYTDASYSYDLPVEYLSYLKTNGSANVNPGTVTAERQFVKIKRLASIQFPNGEVVFVPCTKGRADLIGDNALGKIEIENKAGIIQREFDLSYDYLIGTNLVPYDSVSFTGENNYYLGDPNTYPPAFSRRLMLMSVVEKDKNGIAENAGYQFKYFHEYGLPNRAYPLTDYWGYANQAEVSNPSPPSFVNINGVNYITGKDPSFANAQEGSLYQISYPTGGYTTYDYEEQECKLMPILPPVTQQTGGAYLEISHVNYNHYLYPYEIREWQGFTSRHYYQEFTVDSGPTTIQITLQNVPYYSTGVLGFYIVNIQNDDPSEALWMQSTNGTYVLTLPAGTYKLYDYPSEALLNDPSDPNASVVYSATISPWEEIVNTDPYVVGGLRIKKITTYDSVTNKSLIKEFSYNLNGGSLSSGEALSAPLFSYSMQMTDDANNTNTYDIFSSSSFYPLATTQGAYVGYSSVTEQDVDIQGNPLGETVYQYLGPFSAPDVYPDGNSVSTFNQLPFPPADNRDWLRGYLADQKVYRYEDSSYSLIKEITNSYTKYMDTVSKACKYGFSNQGPNVNYSTTVGLTYYIYSGYIFPDSTVTQEFYNNTDIQKVVKYNYSPKSLLPIEITTNNSDGTMDYQYLSYPLEYLPGVPFIDTLVNNNIVNVPIEDVKVKKDIQGNIHIISGTITKYKIQEKGEKDTLFSLENSAPVPLSSFKFSNEPPGTLPTATTNTVFSPDSRYRPLVSYNQYDAFGNLLDVSRINDIHYSYIWDYNNVYPIAEAVNASQSDIAYTSFEADGKGNWTFSGTPTSAEGGMTGTMSYSLASGAISKSGLTSSTKYIVSYWLYSGGSASVSGGTESNNITGYTANGWTYHEMTITGTTSVSITGSGYIDELRLYPSDAQMTTYTYEPLVGMTSRCSPDNKIQYYDYDALGRLQDIKDMNGNIIKTYQYHYTTTGN